MNIELLQTKALFWTFYFPREYGCIFNARVVVGKNA